MFFTGLTAFAQNTNLFVTGHVRNSVNQQPVANHTVAVTLFADSINSNLPIVDSALTDQSGWYYLTFTAPNPAGTAMAFTVGTPDCNLQWIQQSFVFSGNITQFTADFSICTDSIPPPSPCENFITLTGIQGLTASLQGSLLNGQTASFIWNMGDGVTITGQNVTHTYAQQGVYNVGLQTVTADGCIDFSTFPLVLMDSIYPPSLCENFISLGGIQGLTVNMQGNLITGQPASYFWNLGDGTSASGQNVTHTYAQPGFYNIVLQTVTPDSCMATSGYPLMLMDSLNNGCSSYIISYPTGNPFEIAFQGVTQNQLPATFTWEFGDGTSGAGQSPVHTYPCVGTFLVVMTASDTSGCSSTSVAQVMVFPDSTGNLSIYGQVIAGNNLLSHGNVTLFGTDPSGFLFPVQNVLIDSIGYYNFSNIGPGTYIILAFPEPDSLMNIQYLPTYYGNVIFWEQATPVILGVPQNPYNIYLVGFDSIGGGGGYVSGQINSGGKAMLVAGQEVLLLDLNNTPVRSTYTNAMGAFSFASLPYGEYKVNPVITGMTTQPAQVNLNASNPSASVVMTVNGHLITGISESKNLNLINMVYPNPAVNSVTISLKPGGNVTVQILDASGKVVKAENLSVPAEGLQFTVHVSDLKPGPYFIVVRDEKGNLSSRRFVKN